MRALLFVTSVVLSVGFAAASQATTSPYDQICENARLRSVERADCRAQMKAAQNDDIRRDVFQTFNRKANGALAQDVTPAKPEQGNPAQ